MRRASLFVWVAVASCLLAAQASIAAQGSTGTLVDVKWLEQHLMRA